MVKTLSEGTKLGASIFLDVVPNAFDLNTQVIPLQFVSTNAIGN